MSPEVSVSLTNTLLSVAEAYGAKVDEILNECGIVKTVLEDPDNRISFEQQERLWSVLVERCQEENFGLKVGKRTEPGSFNILGYIAMNSSNLAEAFHYIQDYQNIVGEGGNIEVLPNSHDNTQMNTVIRYTPLNSDLPVTKERVAAVISSWIKMGQWLVGSFVIEKVCFTAPLPHCRDEYDQFFQCAVLFEQAHNQIELSPLIMNAKMNQANSTLCEMLREKADSLIQDINQTGSLRESVISLISLRLIDGEPDRSDIAGALNMSPRTLQRKLSDGGDSFQALVNETRQQLAEYHLGRDELSASEISYLLGFSEPSNFYRAFKKWTGQTPGQYRNHS